MPIKKQDNSIYYFMFAVLFIMAVMISASAGRAAAIADGVIAPSVADYESGLAASGSSNVFSNIFYGLKVAFTHPENLLFAKDYISYCFKPFLLLITAFTFWLWMQITRAKATHQDAPGKEKGQAHWGDVKDFCKHEVTPQSKEDIKNGVPEKNIILGKGLKISLTQDGISPVDQRNANVLVVGGSGTGKTRYVIKPNILQMNGSYIITDPSGEILQSCGMMLRKNGYNVKIFSVSDMSISNVYNPFDYICKEDGKTVDPVKVRVMVDTFLKNVDPDKKGGDPFWDKSASAWMTFAIFYLMEFTPVTDHNMYNLLVLAQAGRTDEESSSSTTELDVLVEQARKQNKNAKCFSSYDTFKLAPAKTANSILVTIAVDLDLFGSSDEVRNMTTTGYLCKRNLDGYITEYVTYVGDDGEDEFIRDESNLDLDKIGDEKTALFVNIPSTNTAYNFLISMMYSQAFDSLYSRAETVSPNRWNIHQANGEVLSSQYRSEEEANRHLKLFAESSVKEEDGHFFLYNKDAKWDETIPAKRLTKSGIGCLKEVFSREVGETFIRNYKSAYVKKGELRLPVPTQCLLDEFANIGAIPNFEKLLATMRKYKLSCMVILQSNAQIKGLYKDQWASIIGNCDTFIFLGSSDMDTDKDLSEKLGKATIRIMSVSESRGRSGSVSSSYSMADRSLMDPAELSRLDNSKCIVSVRGFYPMIVDKYSYTDHPNYKQTGDFDKSQKMTRDYLLENYACKNKETLDAEELDDKLDQDNELIHNNVNPDSTSDGFGDAAPSTVNNPDDLAKVVGADSSSPEDIRAKVRPACDEDVETEAYDNSAIMSGSEMSAYNEGMYGSEQDSENSGDEVSSDDSDDISTESGNGNSSDSSDTCSESDSSDSDIEGDDISPESMDMPAGDSWAMF